MLLSTSLSHKYRLKRSGLLCTNHNGCRESPEFTKKIRKNCQYLKYTTILFSSSRRVHLFVINCSVNETFTLPFNQSFYRSSSCACRVRYCFFHFSPSSAECWYFAKTVVDIVKVFFIWYDHIQFSVLNFEILSERIMFNVRHVNAS